jgi:hypothetical protein
MANAAPDIRSVWPYVEHRYSWDRDSSPGVNIRRDRPPQRSIGLRAPTSFPVLLSEGAHTARCKATQLSASGILLDRGRDLSEREQRSVLRLELLLPDARPVRVLARVVRRAAQNTYALKFVAVSDVDRLTLMEHLDRQQAESVKLLEEIERVLDS